MSPQLVKKMKDDLKEFDVSCATIHFSPREPLTSHLIKKF
jgi:hypothetical protein